MKSVFSLGLIAVLSFFISICSLAQTANERERTAELKITSKEVSAVQTALREHGYYDAKINGILNQETRAALRRYQTEQGLTPSGRIDQATLDKLEIEYPVKDKKPGPLRSTATAVKDHTVSTGKAVGGVAHTVGKKSKAGAEKTVEVTTNAVDKVKPGSKSQTKK